MVLIDTLLGLIFLALVSEYPYLHLTHSNAAVVFLLLLISLSVLIRCVSVVYTAVGGGKREVLEVLR